MRFERIGAQAFGRLKQWESPELCKNMIVVYGKNESGKTTLFKLISTILYGWSPVANNPYMPWDEGDASCDAWLLDGEGKEIKVNRRLRSRAEGYVVMDGIKHDIGNRAIAQLDSLPVQIFNEVYALTLDDLRSLNEEVWQKLQDQLLGGQYRSLFNPASEITSSLDSEANCLWRPDRLGKPKDKLLKETQKALRNKLKEAEENEKYMHETERQLDDLKREIRDLTEEKVEVIKYLDRSARLYPVQKKLKKIDSLLSRAGELKDYDSIPDEAGKELKKLEDIIAGFQKKYGEAVCEKQKIEENIKSFDSLERDIYERRGEIYTLVRSYNQIENDIKTSRDLENDMMRCMDRLCDRAKDFIKGGWKDEVGEVLKHIDEAELRAAIQHYKSAGLRCMEQEARTAGLKVRLGGRKMSKALPFAGFLTAVFGTAGTVLMGSTPLGLLSGIMAGAGIISIFIYLFYKGSSSAAVELKEAQKELNRLMSMKADGALNVKAALKGLPIAQNMLDEPDESLLVDVNTLRDLLYDAEDTKNKIHSAYTRIKESQKKVADLMEACDMEYAADVLKNITRIEQRLSLAQERFRLAESGRSRLQDIDEKLSGLESGLRNVQKVRKQMLDALDRLEGSDLEEKINMLNERRRNFQMALAIREDLEHDYPDLEEVIIDIKRAEDGGEEWIFDEDRIARIKIRREEIDKRLNELNETVGSMKKELEKRQEGERLDDIKGQIEELSDERKQAAQKRDRLILLKKVLLEADRRFREEHQPDMLLKAGRYLDLITDGRYTRLFVEEGSEENLMVKCNYLDYFINMKNQMLSRGTKEQIYLSLRLALADHLDSEEERLPIFLDEALVNWDGVRLENGLKLLQNVARSRQVFLFTCHDRMVHRISQICDAQVISTFAD